MLQSRITSFIGGFAIASGFALYSVRHDIWASHNVLAAQVRQCGRPVHDREIEDRNFRAADSQARGSRCLQVSLPVRAGGDGAFHEKRCWYYFLVL
eukprot:1195539-Prorocentrum_minimum.AAC.3